MRRHDLKLSFDPLSVVVWAFLGGASVLGVLALRTIVLFCSS
jgi:hypothetical protein